MDELKNHNWGLTLIFCLIFGVLGFIVAKVSGSNSGGDHKMMLHEMHSGADGKLMEWISKEGGKIKINLDGEGGNFVTVDLDTTYQENGVTVRRIEKKVKVGE